MAWDEVGFEDRYRSHLTDATAAQDAVGELIDRLRNGEQLIFVCFENTMRDWLAAELTRSEARELAGASEATFALAAYVETHDPIEGARDAAEQALAPGGDAMVSKRDRLDETMSGVGDLL